MGRLTGKLGQKSAYPRWEVLLALAMLYLSPFVSPLLSLVALAIFAFRVVLNDARTFATDYALLVPIAPLFSFEGMSLLLLLGLFAAVWYFFMQKQCQSTLYMVLLVVFNYILLRMPWNFSGFVLCVGQLFMLAVLLPLQDADSAQRAAKLFCLSLIVSSFFALVMRDSSELLYLRGAEYPAFWGSSTYRFNGLFADPNYYMTMIVTAITLLMVLLDRKIVKLPVFLLSVASLLVFGIMTFSKTFFLAVIILAIIGIIWLIARKKYLIAFLTLAAIAILIVVLVMTSAVFSVMLLRLTSASNMGDLTTGRSDLFTAYYNVITESAANALFGVGLQASNLGRDPHNLYLEITYYMGVVGLAVIICLIVAIICAMKKREKKLLSGYLPLAMAMLLHLTLHGIFSSISYAVFFFAIAATLIEPREG